MRTWFSMCPSLRSSGPHSDRPLERLRRGDHGPHHCRRSTHGQPQSYPQHALCSGRSPPHPDPLAWVRAQAGQHLLPHSGYLPSSRQEQVRNDGGGHKEPSSLDIKNLSLSTSQDHEYDRQHLSLCDVNIAVLEKKSSSHRQRRSSGGRVNDWHPNLRSIFED